MFKLCAGDGRLGEVIPQDGQQGGIPRAGMIEKIVGFERLQLLNTSRYIVRLTLEELSKAGGQLPLTNAV